MVEKFKTFKTLDELVNLMKERNIIVDETSKKRLYYDSHYSIINGYKKLFIARSRDETGDDTYFDGTSFEEIYSLYLLDRELRALFLKELMRTETFLKNVLCYEYYSQFGDGNSYLNQKNFDSKKQTQIKSVIKKFQDTIDYKVNEFQVADLRIRKHNAISYYNDKYGFIPLWVLMRFLNFTDISKMYGVLKDITKTNIAKRITSVNKGSSPLLSQHIYSQIRAFVVFRNICAHDNIFYDHVSWGGRKVYFLYNSLKYYISDECYEDFTLSLKKVLQGFRKNTPFSIISTNKILNIMGFPIDWDIK
jgi:abortive infection bacteriophage resistance protein